MVPLEMALSGVNDKIAALKSAHATTLAAKALHEVFFHLSYRGIIRLG